MNEYNSLLIDNDYKLVNLKKRMTYESVSTQESISDVLNQIER